MLVFAKPNHLSRTHINSSIIISTAADETLNSTKLTGKDGLGRAV